MHKVLIGVPCYTGKLDAEMVSCFMALQQSCPIDLMIVSKMRQDEARNLIVKKAIEGKYSHVLFIDDDNPFPSYTLQRLLNSNVDIICGLVPKRKEPYLFCVFESFDTGFGYRGYKNIEVLPEKELFEIGAVGTGVCLIKTSVLADLYTKTLGFPFDIKNEQYGDRARRLSEDFYFSEIATDNGYKLYCDKTIKCGHIGEHRISYINDDYSIEVK